MLACKAKVKIRYTGKAGEGFVSANPKDAFLGYSLEGARNRAKNLNRMFEIHGIWFVACTSDLAEQVKGEV